MPYLMIETEFEWDEEKNRINIEKHRISFDLAIPLPK